MEQQEAKPLTLDEARQVVSELQVANKELRELLERKEKLQAYELLGGKTSAGAPSIVKEETPKEYAARVMRGEY